MNTQQLTGTVKALFADDNGILIGIKVDSGAKKMAGHPDESIILKPNMILPGLTCEPQASCVRVVIKPRGAATIRQQWNRYNHG